MIVLALAVGYLCFLASTLAFMRGASAPTPAPTVYIEFVVAENEDDDAMIRTLLEIESLPEVTR